MLDLTGKRILITGGSGSLGRHLIKILLNYPVKEIISLSRDEELIKKSEQEYSHSNVKFEIGDICDLNKIVRVMKNINIVFHTAALKHVSIAEKYPREVLRINILGILNILDQCENIERFINVSSDKAINVVNCYGASKLFAEYLVRETNSHFSGKFLNIRCPNLLGSRGSVFDLWQKQLSNGNIIYVSDPKMTRYFITLPKAADYIIKTGLKEKIDPLDVFYPPQELIGKFKLDDLAKAYKNKFGNKNTEIKKVGASAGEKIYEDYICDAKLTSISELEKILLKIK